MSQNPDFSESFYRDHAQRYAEVSHNFIQSVYTETSHPGLKGDTDLMVRLRELVPAGSRGLDAGCGAGARDVYFYWQNGYDILGLDSVEENILEARNLHPEIADRVSVADLREPIGHPDTSFDFVLCNAVIQHIDPDIALGTTLPEFTRAPEGRRRSPAYVQNRTRHCDGLRQGLRSGQDIPAVRRRRGCRSAGRPGPERNSGGGREAGRTHVFQGPQANGPLRPFRAQSWMNGRPLAS